MTLDHDQSPFNEPTIDEYDDGLPLRFTIPICIFIVLALTFVSLTIVFEA